MLLIAQALLAPLLMRWWRLTPAEMGIHLNWSALCQGVGWGGLLAVAGAAWMRHLLQTENSWSTLLFTLPTSADWIFIPALMPLVEEVLFRGAVFGALLRRWHPGCAVLLSAGISTVLHPIEPWQLFVFLTAIGYTLAMRWSGSLLAPILAHCLVNATMLFFRIDPSRCAALSSTMLLSVTLVSLALIVTTRSLNEARSSVTTRLE